MAEASLSVVVLDATAVPLTMYADGHRRRRWPSAYTNAAFVLGQALSYLPRRSITTVTAAAASAATTVTAAAASGTIATADATGYATTSPPEHRLVFHEFYDKKTCQWVSTLERTLGRGTSGTRTRSSTSGSRFSNLFLTFTFIKIF